MLQKGLTRDGAYLLRVYIMKMPGTEGQGPKDTQDKAVFAERKGGLTSQRTGTNQHLKTWSGQSGPFRILVKSRAYPCISKITRNIINRQKLYINCYNKLSCTYRTQTADTLMVHNCSENM